MADALASALSALTFIFSMKRSRSTVERLLSASDRLPPACCWMATTICRNFTSGNGMRVVSLLERFAQRYADALLLDDLAELAGQRLLALARDDGQALVQRQARLHAAHDDVDRIRQLGEELRLAPGR